MNRHGRFLVIVMTISSLVGSTEAVWAYGGPGSIVSGIGAFLAVLAAIVAAIFGFFWFPLKRLYKKIFDGRDEEDVSQAP